MQKQNNNTNASGIKCPLLFLVLGKHIAITQQITATTQSAMNV